MKKAQFATCSARKDDKKITQFFFLENLQEGFVTPCHRKKIILNGVIKRGGGVCKFWNFACSD